MFTTKTNKTTNFIEWYTVVPLNEMHPTNNMITKYHAAPLS